jgi:glycosyltransferase involved in cell wall biosynthesis
VENRKRILYLTFDFLDPIFSGNGTLSKIQVIGLLESGFEVMVLCPDHGEINSDMKRWIDQGDLKILPIHIESIKELSPSCDWKGFHSKAEKKGEEITLFNPHLIINVDWHIIDFAAEVKNKLSIPLISQFFRIFSYFKEYIPSDNDYNLVKQKELKIVSQSDSIIVLSKFDKQWCEEQGARRVNVIYPPLSNSFIDTLIKISKIESSREYKKIQFITVSRIVPEKRIHRIFPILDELKAMGIPFTYIIIGELLDKKYEQFIQKEIENTNLKNSIRFLGRLSIEELVLYLSQSALYIHTSSYEPFGITIIEAAAVGCGIILDKKGLIGAKEVLEKLDFRSIEKIDFFDPMGSALTIRNAISKKKKRTIDLERVSKLCPQQHVENLVKIFRDFL